MRAATLTPTAWSDRAPLPAAPDETSLGDLVVAELLRLDDLLFTMSPRDELDEIGRTQRLKDQAFALQLQAILRIWQRTGDSEREFLGDELALSLNISPTAAANLLSFALSVGELPGALDALHSGLWSERHLRAAVTELDLWALTPAQRQAIGFVTLASYRDQTPGQLRDLLRRTILRIDPQATKATKERADADRCVAFYPTADGQAALHAHGPVELIAEIRAALEHALAEQQRARGDDRTASQRRFDLLHELVTGGSAAGGWLAVVLAPADALHEQPAAEQPVAENPVAQDGLGEVPGLGPVTGDTAADLARRAAVFERHDTDRRGRVVAITDRFRDLDRLLQQPAITDPSTDRYVATPRLKRFLEARDRTCTFPGCDRSANRTDKDHLVPWPAGATDPGNMHCLCRHHHRAKQATFTVERLPDGSTAWTTRSGWVFVRRPKGS